MIERYEIWEKRIDIQYAVVDFTCLLYERIANFEFIHEIGIAKNLLQRKIDLQVEHSYLKITTFIAKLMISWQRN